MPSGQPIFNRTKDPMRNRYVFPALTAAAALMLTGCVDNSAPAAADKPSASMDAAAPKNEKIAALLPAKIKSAGVLNVGMANNYPPNELRIPTAPRPAGPWTSPRRWASLSA